MLVSCGEEREEPALVDNGIALIRVLISAGYSRTMSSPAAKFNDGSRSNLCNTNSWPSGSLETGVNPIQPVL